MTPNVFHLAATELIGCGKEGILLVGKGGNHRLPDHLPHLDIGLFEANLVEETAFEGRVQVLGEVSGGLAPS